MGRSGERGGGWERKEGLSCEWEGGPGEGREMMWRGGEREVMPLMAISQAHWFGIGTGPFAERENEEAQE